MICLASTGDLLEVTSGSSVSSIHVHASYVDYNGTTTTPGYANTLITSSTSITTVVGSPGSSVQRNVKTLTVFNSSATASLITITHTDGSNAVQLYVYTLLPNELIQYSEKDGFSVIDALGRIKFSGAFLGRFVGSGTTYTVSKSTRTLLVRLLGAGGGGGGVQGNTTDYSVGGGGAAGGYSEQIFYVTPGTTYTIQVGAGGSGGANTGANGNNGTASTFSAPTSVGAANTVISASGGAGGVGLGNNATLTQIIAGGAVTAPGNGTVAAAGQGGGFGFRSNGTVGFSGAGGSSAFGAGGAAAWPGANANGANGSGFGSGGAGGSSGQNAAPKIGGSGAPGLIIVDEFS